MKKRVLAALAVGVFVLNMGAFVFADGKRKGPVRRQPTTLTALLPASDVVAAVNVRGLLNDALPRLLAARPDLFAALTAKISEMQQKTGIDLRSFDSAAVGALVKSGPGKNLDFDPVILARGQTNAAALIGAAKIALNGKYRTITIGDKSVYIVAVTKPNSASRPAPAIAREMPEIAFTAYDGNTVAVGSPLRLRQLFAAGPRLASDMVAAVSEPADSVANFAANLPNGFGTFLPLQDDEFGRTLASVRFVSGSMTVAENTVLRAAAKTPDAAQAKSLSETLIGMQMIGKGVLGGSAAADKQLYGRLLENAKITVTGRSVNVEVSIAQSDVNLLVGLIK